MIIITITNKSKQYVLHCATDKPWPNAVWLLCWTFDYRSSCGNEDITKINRRLMPLRNVFPEEMLKIF